MTILAKALAFKNETNHFKNLLYLYFFRFRVFENNEVFGVDSGRKKKRIDRKDNRVMCLLTTKITINIDGDESFDSLSSNETLCRPTLTEIIDFSQSVFISFVF